MTDLGSTPEHWRLVTFNQGCPAHQLALGEAMLEAIARREQPPTLRLYAFSTPTLVLGMAQSLAHVAVERCHERGIALVRRASGGTAVFHDAQTYSFDLIVPAGHRLAGSDVHRNYAHLADVLLAALARLQVTARATTLEESRAEQADTGLDAVCFASRAPFEILVEERKLMGLAQIRRLGATMLHGAIYARFDAGQTLELLHPHATDQAMLERDLPRLTERVTDLCRSTGRTIDADVWGDALRQATSDVLGATFVTCSPSEFELERARALESEKYGSLEWTHRR